MSTEKDKNKCFILFGVPMCIYTREELENTIKLFLKSEKGSKIAKVNTEFLNRALKDKRFLSSLKGFDLNIADGSGVLWVAKYLQLPLTKIPIIKTVQAIWQMVYSGASLVFYPKYCTDPIPERFPGVEALYLMLGAAQKTKSGVFFLGAEQHIARRALEKIKKELPDLAVLRNEGEYYYPSKNQEYDDQNIINEINQSEAKLLVVALGSPKQEYWIDEFLPKLKYVRVAVGEGGSLDRIAGTFRMAPEWMSKIGLEWLWRLLSRQSKADTGNRTKRVWNAVPVFIYNVVKYKIKNS